MDPLITKHFQELRLVLESLDSRCSQLESSRAPTRSRHFASQNIAIPTPDAQHGVKALRRDITLVKTKLRELEVLLCSPPSTPYSRIGAPEDALGTEATASHSVSTPSPSTSPQSTPDLRPRSPADTSLVSENIPSSSTATSSNSPSTIEPQSFTRSTSTELPAVSVASTPDTEPPIASPVTLRASTPDTESQEASPVTPRARTPDVEQPPAPEAESQATAPIASRASTPDTESPPVSPISPKSPTTIESQFTLSNEIIQAGGAQPPPEEPISTPCTEYLFMKVPKTTPRPTARLQELYNEQTDERFSLKLSQMGKFLPRHLARFAQDKLFRGVVKIQKALFRWEELRSKLEAPAQDAPVTLVKWIREMDDFKRTPRLESFVSEDFNWHPPDLSHSNRPPFSVVYSFLESLACSPPPDPVAYYVGPSLATEFDALLHPGKQLAGLPTLPGVNTPYWHFGVKASGTAYHCEDAAWRSYNLVVGPGWKIWVVIDKSDNIKFLEFINRHWKLGKCKQAVRHLNLFIPPSVLEAEHIGFRIRCLGEGEIFVTQDDEYHCVVNYTSCLALAINHLHPGEPAFPPSLKVCRECGIYPLDHPSFEKVPYTLESNSIRTRKRPANATCSTNPKRSRDNTIKKSYQNRPRSLQIGPVLEKIKGEIRSLDRRCHIPSHKMDPMPCVDVFRFACALGSRATVCQFKALVDQHRDYTDPQLARQDHSGYVKAIVKAGARANLAQLHMRLYKLELFKPVAPRLQGKTRATRGVTTDSANQLGVPIRTYHRWQAEGKAWSRTYGSSRGLLSLIPFKAEDPHGKSAREYFELDETQRDFLHRLLEEDEYMKAICAAALAFQGSIWEGGSHVQFGWEESTSPDFSTCAEATILRHLQPFPFTEFNIWKGGDLPWPSDPTAISVGDRVCDYCDEVPCHCPDPTTRTSLLIRRFGTTLGLEAATTSTSSGVIVYPKDAFIGVVAGKLLPLGTLDPEEPWTFDFERPDMQASAACQICMSSMGSCLRLLTTSESPTARLVTKRRAGQWILAAEATRDVMIRDQITVLSLPWRRSRGCSSV
ncbi:hypothetical protein B0T11DRAFT_282914 [Plectosphaerella cucumerina]|uniref:JmjC domain-containing protein n=1 Tax=Plectosphaerella cucumerina TaxID=40658 RepID=A0A8K0THR9_9PEZI|nr:hypothetical protein B0T11DRAFT_282914 [Plectosphaerella cucumerina]